MRAVVCGANGAMGKLLQQRLQGNIAGLVSIDGENNVPRDFAQLGKVDADVIIDFSNAGAIDDLLVYSVEKQIPVVLCTTGLSDAQLEAARTAATKVAILRSANMSLGINTLMELL